MSWNGNKMIISPVAKLVPICSVIISSFLQAWGCLCHLIFQIKLIVGCSIFTTCLSLENLLLFAFLSFFYARRLAFVILYVSSRLGVREGWVLLGFIRGFERIVWKTSTEPKPHWTGLNFRMNLNSDWTPNLLTQQQSLTSLSSLMPQQNLVASLSRTVAGTKQI